ncbi:hypothetical protein [uncultured Thiohalocapsa sp.]|uniref:hypothetical protein n=1 Tax=uncultured Thiohalocapsa sp. TaxID=768990 RepID=UPI0025D6C7C1|nr:hypothetical protein [uncultured Thiohalocapsa sp.]
MVDDLSALLRLALEHNDACTPATTTRYPTTWGDDDYWPCLSKIGTGSEKRGFRFPSFSATCVAENGGPSWPARGTPIYRHFPGAECRGAAYAVVAPGLQAAAI